MSVLMRADQAMEACARALETYSGGDMGRPDALAIYSAAAQIEAACMAASSSVQTDNRLPVPDYLAKFASAQVQGAVQ